MRGFFFAKYTTTYNQIKILLKRKEDRMDTGEATGSIFHSCNQDEITRKINLSGSIGRFAIDS